MRLAQLHGRMDGVEQAMVFLAAAMVCSALALPIWHVHLWAPQYPEGMDLNIFARTITGSLQNINILNHYIGMKPVSARSFPEFHWMTPALGSLAGVIFASGLTKRREAMLVAWAALYGFCAYMLWDLYHWMYNWGHQLASNAPITVAPFTPPALGWEHIANFYVMSFPSWGGLGVVLATVVGAFTVWHAIRS